MIDWLIFFLRQTHRFSSLVSNEHGNATWNWTPIIVWMLKTHSEYWTGRSALTLAFIATEARRIYSNQSSLEPSLIDFSNMQTFCVISSWFLFFGEGGGEGGEGKWWMLAARICTDLHGFAAQLGRVDSFWLLEGIITLFMLGWLRLNPWWHNHIIHWCWYCVSYFPRVRRHVNNCFDCLVEMLEYSKLLAFFCVKFSTRSDDVLQQSQIEWHQQLGAFSSLLLLPPPPLGF